MTGKTVGVIGTGRIGQAFIKKAVGFDVDFLCFNARIEQPDFAQKIQETMDVRFRNGFTDVQRTIRYASFEEILSGSDFVSIHAPLVRTKGTWMLTKSLPTEFLRTRVTDGSLQSVKPLRSEHPWSPESSARSRVVQFER